MQRTRTLFKMLTPPIWLGALILSLNLCGGLARASDEPDDDKDHPHSTAEDFLRSNVRPIAIGHHGVGPNTGENPALPIEKSKEFQELLRPGQNPVTADSPVLRLTGTISSFNPGSRKKRYVVGHGAGAAEI